jgi:hypothetical protein
MAIDSSNSIREVIEYLNRPVNNGGYTTIKHWARSYGLTLPQHGKDQTLKNLKPFAKIPDDEYFAKGVYRNGNGSKKRLVDMGWKNECNVCKLPPEWNGRPLTLQLDHINGDNMDNRIDNLQILCPNCHTQTTTYGNKNK